MKVLLSTDVFPPGSGGSGRSTATLATALIRRGHRVRVVVARTRCQGQQEWRGVPVSEVEVPQATFGGRVRERLLRKGLTKAIGEESWDLVHAQHWLSAVAASKICSNLPMVVTVRDYWPICIWSTMLSGHERCPGCNYTRRVVCSARQKRWLTPVAPVIPLLIGAELSKRQQVLSEASAVVAVSQHVAEKLSSETERVHVVPNFVTSEKFKLAPPVDLPDRYVLFVGKLEVNKAPDQLFSIVKGIEADIPLVIAGSGSLETELRRQAACLQREVRFLGWVDENIVLSLMRYALAVVFPSRWEEPLSRVLIDGLAVGAVLIVQRTGGSEEIVVHEESGLMGDTTEAISQSLRRVLADDVFAERLRVGARARADTVFSENVVLPRLEALYRDVAGL